MRKTTANGRCLGATVDIIHEKLQRKLCIEWIQNFSSRARLSRTLQLNCAYRPHSGRSCAIPGRSASRWTGLNDSCRRNTRQESVSSPLEVRYLVSILSVTRWLHSRLHGHKPGKHGHAEEATPVGWMDRTFGRLGFYLSYVASEDDLRVAAQLGEILDPPGPFEKTKRAAVSQQPLVN